jgi:hypothetical protein
MTKTTKPMIRIHDLISNEIIDREMTNDEFAQYELDQAEYANAKAEAKAKATAKANILDRIGLTADELQTILG